MRSMYEPSEPLMKMLPDNGSDLSWPQPSYKAKGNTFTSDGISNAKPSGNKNSKRKRKN